MKTYTKQAAAAVAPRKSPIVYQGTTERKTHKLKSSLNPASLRTALKAFNERRISAQEGADLLDISLASFYRHFDEWDAN